MLFLIYRLNCVSDTTDVRKARTDSLLTSYNICAHHLITLPQLFISLHLSSATFSFVMARMIPHENWEIRNNCSISAAKEHDLFFDFKIKCARLAERKYYVNFNTDVRAYLCEICGVRNGSLHRRRNLNIRECLFADCSNTKETIFKMIMYRKIIKNRTHASTFPP